MKDFTYVLFNKPYGVLCQFTDKEGRPTLRDYIPIKDIYPVGRLDMDSEGLLFLTNDGKLSHKMADPRFKVEKTYLAQVEGIVSKKNIEILEKGVMIEGQRTRPAKVELLKDEPDLWEREKPIRCRKTVPVSWLKIKIAEGRNRQVRKMTAAVGLPCLRLVRTSIGKAKLKGLLPGQLKRVGLDEII